jgi:hypothetical protein
VFCAPTPSTWSSIAVARAATTIICSEVWTESGFTNKKQPGATYSYCAAPVTAEKPKQTGTAKNYLGIMKYNHDPQADPLVETVLWEIIILDLVTKLCKNPPYRYTQTSLVSETPDLLAEAVQPTPTVH